MRTDNGEPNEAAEELDCRRIVADWLASFGAAVAAANLDDVIALFGVDPWWRDLYALTYDITSMHGAHEIKAVLDKVMVSRQFGEISLDDSYGPVLGPDGNLSGLFRFTTDVGLGRGVVRLVSDDDGGWRAWTVSTSLDGLKDFPEAVVSIADASKDEHNQPLRPGERLSWQERQERRVSFRDSDPSVLILGAGHTGLFLAARLKQLNVPTLVVDTYARAGDNWRLRYNNLLLHDPKWTVQFPYMPFPDTWPLFTPKEMLADWIEAYVNFLQLNLWTSAHVSGATYDKVSKRWTVVIDHDGELRTLHPNHLVFATGNHGVPSMPTVRGAESFRGTIAHSSLYEGGSSTGEKVVVIGSGSSGCDVAQDAYENGATVTMVQRGETHVWSQRNGVPVIHGDYYSESSPPVAEADVLAYSMPMPLMIASFAQPTKIVAERDKELLDGLNRAGFRTTLGPGDVGALHFAVTRGGGYYIDKGAAQLIINGEIRVRRGEIDHFIETGVVYADGSADEADVVVFCTGYVNMRESARPVLGDDVTEQLGLVWGLDEQGEIRTTFRHSGHEKLWFAAGGFQQARIHSKHLALLIKAIDEGIIDPHISVERKTKTG